MYYCDSQIKHDCPKQSNGTSTQKRLARIEPAQCVCYKSTTELVIRFILVRQNLWKMVQSIVFANNKTPDGVFHSILWSKINNAKQCLTPDVLLFAKSIQCYLVSKL